MTNAPYLLPKTRGGSRMGHGQVIDHMFLDGLEDAYDKGRLMGTFAEDCAQNYQFTREAQDDFALAVADPRAGGGRRTGAFDARDRAGHRPDRGGETVVETDEQPGKRAAGQDPAL